MTVKERKPTVFVANTAALKQQAWRAHDVFTRMEEYARLIGCTVIHDEIECHTEEQSRLLGRWWTENADG